ncbi:hypothetical protein EL22_27045 [Halostagnicola sp. A56]|uniref:DUF6498-containing protein n=1 Tax=Halostagnicola sp. A56 TaxID=1495067 RepID=UPI00049EFFC8|nr:DUF6498-containing protein [Halostagnicola sp. A56]KMT45818.1 hypothetical protein EL22_27045 [Halostagnicola sp. A56]
MVALERLRTTGATPELVAVIVSNLLPLVGVLLLEWNAATLVTVYWFELGVLCFWALVRALFAGRPSEFDPEMYLLGALVDRPVSVPIPRTGLEIRLSTLPIFAMAVPILSLIWFATGAVTVGLVGGHALESSAIETGVLAVGVLFLTEGSRTGLEYFYRQGYREHSAQTAVRGVIWRIGVLFIVGLCIAVLAVGADPAVASDESIAAVDPTIVGLPLLIGIVLVKSGFDLADVYRDRLAALGKSIGEHFDSGETPATPGNTPTAHAHTPATPEPIDDSVPDAEKRVRPPVGGRLLVPWAHLKRYPNLWFVGVFIAAGGLLFAFDGAWSIVAGFGVVAVAVTTLSIHLDYWLRYAFVEYRIDDDAIVGYDRLFRQPVWHIETSGQHTARLERDWIDGRLETATVIVEHPATDRTLWLPRACDPAAILEVLDRQSDESVRAKSNRSSPSKGS